MSIDTCMHVINYYLHSSIFEYHKKCKFIKKPFIWGSNKLQQECCVCVCVGGGGLNEGGF